MKQKNYENREENWKRNSEIKILKTKIELFLFRSFLLFRKFYSEFMNNFQREMFESGPAAVQWSIEFPFWITCEPPLRFFCRT